MKILDIFRPKVKTVYSGIEVLGRLTGTPWGLTKQLKSYEKSLYVFACVSKIAEKVASTEFQIFLIKNSNGDIEELPNHPALDLLYKVNPFQTKTEFLKITVTNLKLAGDAFWFKVRNDAGVVVELWNLRPDKIEIVKDPQLFIKAYKFHKDDGTSVNFAPEDIVHFKLPTPLDDYLGCAPVKSASTRIDTEEYAGAWQRDMFMNSARPDGILKYSGILTKEEKEEMRENWDLAYHGRGKNGKLAILQSGLEYQQVSVSPREMDFIESMKFTRDDILVAFQVPKPIVAITDDVNLANAKTAMTIFLAETIKPLVDYLCEKANEMLIIPDFGDRYFLDFPDPTPENRDQITAEYANGITNGWLLINEVRAKENLPPIEGGDSLYKPFGVVAVGTLQQAKTREAFLVAKENMERKRRQKVFRGRQKLRLVLETLETTIKKKVRKGLKKKNKGFRHFIEGAEMKKIYADGVNKDIDEKARVFKEKVDEFAIGEKKKLLVFLKDMDFKKALGGESRAAIHSFYKKQGELWAEFGFPYIEEWARTSGQFAAHALNPDNSFTINERIRKVLKARADEFGFQVTDTTAQKIADTLAEGVEASEGINELMGRVDSVYEGFPANRSALIARTEATAANNNGFIEAYKQSGLVTHKEWINAGDDRVREEHQDGVGVGGEIVPLDEVFSNGLEFPQEPNCRCVIAPVLEEE